jgi:hypothetical protein
MRRPDLVFRQPRISLEQEGPNLIGPEQVYDFLVRQHGVRERTAAADEHDQKKRRRADRKQAPTLGYGA